jgi:hypothetical protein
MYLQLLLLSRYHHLLLLTLPSSDRCHQLRSGLLWDNRLPLQLEIVSAA